MQRKSNNKEEKIQVDLTDGVRTKYTKGSFYHQGFTYVVEEGIGGGLVFSKYSNVSSFSSCSLGVPKECLGSFLECLDHVLEQMEN